MNDLTAESAEGAEEEKREVISISNFYWGKTLWKLDSLKLS